MRTQRTYLPENGRTLYPVDFELGYLNKYHIKVFIDEDNPQNEVSYTWINENQIQLSEPFSADKLYIRRIVPKSTLWVNFTDGARLKETNLDDANRQCLMATEEVLDGFFDRVVIDYLENLVTLSTEQADRAEQEADRSTTEADRASDEVDRLDGLVQDAINAVAGANFVGEEPPTEFLVQGVRWYKPSETTTYVYYVDADSAQWVQEPVQSAEGTLRDELGASDSTVLVGGVEAGSLSAQSHILAVDYLPTGYVTDGSVDYTSQIQQAINDGSAQKKAVELPDFPVQVVVESTFPGKGLVVPSNSVVLHKGNGEGELRLAPNGNGNYRMMLLSDVSNVFLYNVKLRGDKFTHTGTAGEWGHGLVIEGNCENITVVRPELYDFWGDGLYIGQKSLSDPTCPKRIYMENVFIDNARRNGFSLISADDLWVNGITTNNTRSDNSATALPAGPHAGIDIEPNNGTAVLNKIRIDNVKGFNNQDGLFYVYLTTYAPDFTTSSGYVDITVNGVSDDSSLFAVRMAGIGNVGKVQGHITINDVAAKDTLASAFVCTNWGFDVGLPVTINGLSCANTGKGFSGNKFASPVSVYQDNAGFGDIGNVTVNALSIQRDDFGVGALAYATNVGGLVKNVNVNVTHAHYGAVGTRYFGNAVNGVVNWTTPKNSTLYTETVAASKTIGTIFNQGVINVNSTSSPTITLPTIQAGMENAEIEFYITAVLAHCDIFVSSGAIRSRGDSGVRYRIFAGDRVRLRARSGGIWNVVHVDGLFVRQA